MKKVNILGCHESGENICIKDGEIWTMNFGVTKYKNIDLLFDLHSWNKSSYIPKYYSILSDIKIPVVKLEHDPNIKNEILFNEKKIIEILGFRPCTTVAYMIAYAILNKYTFINFYGITDQFYDIRPQQGFSFARALGVAYAKGIKCKLHNFFLGEDVGLKRDIQWFGIYRGGYIG